MGKNRNVENIKKLFFKAKEILHYLYVKKVSTIAGSLSFFFVLSIVPMIFLSFYIIYFFSEHMGVPYDPELMDFFTFDFSSSISLFFILTTCYSASKLFYHLRRSGELIFEYKDKQKSMRVRMSAISYMITFVFAISASVAFITVLNTLIVESRWIFITLSIISVSFLLIIALLAVNKYTAQGKEKLFKYYKGALFTFGFDIVMSVGFVIYIEYFANYDYLYSYLASIIIFFIYVYFLMQGLIYGFIINYKFMKKIEKVR